MFLFPVLFPITAASKTVDDGRVRGFGTAELSTLLLYGRVDQAQMHETISGNIGTFFLNAIR